MNQALNRNRLFPLILGPVVFLITLLFFHPDGLSTQANAVLACTLWVGIWWITDCIPLAVTSLLPIILFPLSGGLDIKATTASYGHKYVFLYIGGFIIAIAIERWNLHKRISLIIINLIGTDLKKIVLGFMMATAFLSMWISNTATSVMMLPIGMAILALMKDDPSTKKNEVQVFGKALMLAIAYSASIGGLSTLIGTPPNLILAGIVKEQYGIEITFSQWILLGLPLSLILLAICWKYLTSFAFDLGQDMFEEGRAEIKRQLDKLGKTSYEERVVLSTFILTAVLWMSRSLLNQWIPALDDTIIAMISAVLLFIIPASDKKRTILTWNEAVKLPWGILLLFGGGLALATGFQQSGLAEFIGSQLSLMQGASIILILIVVVVAVNFLTEITSNIATTAMILPILAPLALVIGVHPYVLMVGAALAASCAFMLPVATPPNAVVFGSGYLKISDMVKTGIWLNIISIILVVLVVYFLMPLVWGIEINAPLIK